MSALPENTPPRRILLIATRRIGDVLLTTPLLRSLRRAWPLALIDVLVFAGTAGILQNNPDVNRIISVAEHPGFWRSLRLLACLFRKYDWAITTLTGDKPVLYAWVAGRQRLGMVEPGTRRQWKRRLLTRTVPFDDLATHTVRMNLQLAQALGIKPTAEIVACWSPQDAERLEQLLPFKACAAPYAVLHMFPNFSYKAWHTQGWIEVARWLQGRGMSVVLSGGSGPEERAYVAAIHALMPPGVLNFAGRLSLSENACLLHHARIYLGPDTATTHLAAGIGVPTVALFGPSNPVKWGPWPRAFDASRNPYELRGSQEQGNVILLQGPGGCVPCMKEGCDGHTRSSSACLEQLSSQQVIKASERLLQ